MRGSRCGRRRRGGGEQRLIVGAEQHAAAAADAHQAVASTHAERIVGVRRLLGTCSTGRTLRWRLGRRLGCGRRAGREARFQRIEREQHRVLVARARHLAVVVGGGTGLRDHGGARGDFFFGARAVEATEQILCVVGLARARGGGGARDLRGLVRRAEQRHGAARCVGAGQRRCGRRGSSGERGRGDGRWRRRAAEQCCELGLEQRNPIGHAVFPDEGVSGDETRGVPGDDLLRAHGSGIGIAQIDGPDHGCLCGFECSVGFSIGNTRPTTVLTVHDDRGAATFAADFDLPAPDFVVGDRVFGATRLAGYLHRGRDLSKLCVAEAIVSIGLS